MEFRVKDLLITSLSTRDGDTDPFCITPTGILCCCVGWTANGTTKSLGHGLTPSHLEALRGEVRAAASADDVRGDDSDLAALEAKLSEALETVRARRRGRPG